VREAVVAQTGDAVAEKITEHFPALRPLDLKRGDIGFIDVDVHAGERRHALRVKECVRVRDREPEPVLVDTQQHGVIDDPAVTRRENRVFALAHLARREIATRDEVREIERVGAGDLDDALDRYVPQRDVVHERPVLSDGIVVQRRQQHVVVQTPALAPVALRRLEIRRLPIPRLDVEREGLGRQGRQRARSSRIS
jgi:hypothetical protein